MPSQTFPQRESVRESIQKSLRDLARIQLDMHSTALQPRDGRAVAGAHRRDRQDAEAAHLIAHSR